MKEGLTAVSHDRVRRGQNKTVPGLNHLNSSYRRHGVAACRICAAGRLSGVWRYVSHPEPTWSVCGKELAAAMLWLSSFTVRACSRMQERNAVGRGASSTIPTNVLSAALVDAEATTLDPGQSAKQTLQGTAQNNTHRCRKAPPESQLLPTSQLGGIPRGSGLSVKSNKVLETW